MNLQQIHLIESWMQDRPDAFPRDCTFGQAWPIACRLEAEEEAKWAIFNDDKGAP